VARDSGTTKGSEASKNNISKVKICLMFAQGCCPHGHECRFLHRIPLESDREEEGVDCFGRERFATDRQDLGGIGSFSRYNTTLYIGAVVPEQEQAQVIFFLYFSLFSLFYFILFYFKTSKY